MCSGLIITSWIRDVHVDYPMILKVSFVKVYIDKAFLWKRG